MRPGIGECTHSCANVRGFWYHCSTYLARDENGGAYNTALHIACLVWKCLLSKARAKMFYT